jgi:hypothetical protein
MGQAIIKADTRDITGRVDEFSQVAKLFADSGMFADVKGAAQCFVKIMAGAEMGIPPFTAMNSFHVIQGKATMAATAIAARVKGSGRYNYEIVKKTAEVCELKFFENGKHVHTEVWDAKRASKAGTKNMDKYPDAMLFARAITAGARAVCPDVIGQFYSPEEMGAVVTDEGTIIDAGAPPATTTEPPTNGTQPPSATPATERTAADGRAKLGEIGKRAKTLSAALQNGGLPYGALENAISDAGLVYRNQQATIGALYQAASDLHAACDEADRLLADVVETPTEGA